MPRRSFPFAAIILTLACARAQDPAPPRRADTPFGSVQVVHDRPNAAAAKRTLWVRYPNEHQWFKDHAQYLADLQVRWQAQGVLVAVAIPAEAAEAVAEAAPGFVVAALDDTEALSATTAALVDGDGESFAWESLDGAVDVLQHAVDGTAPDERTAAFGELLQSLAVVTDGGDLGPVVEHCTSYWPHTGSARALAVLHQWWCVGDLDAARKAFDTGLAALSDAAVPLTVFADLVLRGDHFDRTIPTQLVAALQPVAAAAPDGVFTQLVYLRALLRAGQDRVAGRIIATLPKQLVGRPLDQLVFAETLMDGATPAAMRGVALRAIADAAPNPPDPRWVWGARHKVLSRCGDADAAARLMTSYREESPNGSSLNNDAWYLIVRPETMGRFDSLAFGQADELLRAEGAGINPGYKDTVALAYFVNGRVAEAVEMQADAARAAGNQGTYVARLRRYRETLAMQQATATSGGGKRER